MENYQAIFRLIKSIESYRIIKIVIYKYIKIQLILLNRT